MVGLKAAGAAVNVLGVETTDPTVDAALRSIYSKLEVNTRTGAVAKALKEKLV
jgi:DNA-binding NarL/FixJ family response regulator